MECWPRCSGEGGDQEPEEKSGIADHISIVTPWGSCADTFSPASPNPALTIATTFLNLFAAVLVAVQK